MAAKDKSNSISRTEFLRGMAASVSATVSLAALTNAALTDPADAQSAPGPAPTGIQSKPATAHTRAVNAVFRKSLPFSDVGDFDDARRGRIAGLPEPVIIKNAQGRTVWDLSQYAFIDTAPDSEAPDTINPSLWRMAKLNMFHGLYEVVDGIYQARGYDLSVMTIIRSENGYIVIDPLTSAECAAAVWNDLVLPNLGQKPIVAVIYTHSHVDHYGGVRGILKQEDVDSGKVKVIAPADFVVEAVGENVIAGNAMTRRATYMYGTLLPKGASGQVDGGLGKVVSNGAVGLILPTDYVSKTGDVLSVDGIDLHILMAPASEAPAEFMFYLPQFKAFCAAEDATHTLHNLYTLRGAKVRDGLRWSKYLQQALDMFGADMQVVFNSHHWPTFGNQGSVAHIKAQRDLYRFLHDQVMRLANTGLTPNEIGETLRLPPSLATVWSCRSYYGAVYHDAVSQYNLRLGFYDAVPAHLHPHTPVETGRRYVQFMGGADNVLRQAQVAFDQGDYRWVAEVVNHVVFADAENIPARRLLADTYEQLGYQAESGPWRNVYLTGALELRSGVPKIPMGGSASPDTIRAMPLDLFFDYLGVRLNADRAAGKSVEFTIELTDTKQKYAVGVENSAIHYSSEFIPNNPDASVVMTRAALNDVMMGKTTMEKLVIDGKAVLKGETAKLGEFVSWLDSFDIWFNIVTD